jgi:hypothetical protein
VPACHREHDRGVRLEAREQILGHPLPQRIAKRFAIRLLPVLDRIVDEQELGRQTRRAFASAERSHTAALSRLPILGGVAILGQRDASAHDPPNLPAQLLGELGVVRSNDDAERGVQLEPVRRLADRRLLRLAMPRRQLDDDALQFPRGDAIENTVDVTQVRPIPAVRWRDELTVGTQADRRTVLAVQGIARRFASWCLVGRFGRPLKEIVSPVLSQRQHCR